MKMEKFVRDQMPDVPAVTIRKNGSVCINQKAIDEFNLTKMRFASLHYDREDALLGIKPEENESDPSCFRISKEKGRTFTLNCQSFLKHCGIPYRERSRVFQATWDEETAMILVKLEAHSNGGDLCIRKQINQ